MNLQSHELQGIEVERAQVKEVLRCLLHTILFNRALGPVRPLEVECVGFPDIHYARVDDSTLVRAVETKVEALFTALDRVKDDAGSSALASTGTTSGTSTSSGSAATAPNKTSSAQAKDSASTSATGGGTTGSKATSEKSAAMAAANSDGGTVAAVCTLSFYNKSVKKGFLGLSTKEEKVYWEQWSIPIVLARDRGKASGIERERRQQRRSEALRERLHSIVQAVNDKMEHIPPFKSNSQDLCFPFEITFSNETTHSDTSSWIPSIKRMLQQGPPMLMKNT